MSQRLRPPAMLDRRRGDDALHLASQFRVEGYEGVCLQLREGDVLGPVGLGPPQLLSNLPGVPSQHSVAEEPDRHRPDALEPLDGNLGFDLASVRGLVQSRQRLGAKERRRKKLVLGPDLDLLTCKVKDGAAVDDKSGHAAAHATALSTTRPPGQAKWGGGLSQRSG